MERHVARPVAFLSAMAPRIALVHPGGVALGAYQAGAYASLVLSRTDAEIQSEFPDGSRRTFVSQYVRRADTASSA